MFFLQVYPVLYSDVLTNLIGCRPKIWKYIFTDPKLAYACWYGPMFSAQYRIEGPHSCPDARERFLDAANKTMFAAKSRKVVPFSPESQHKRKKLLFLISLSCVALSVALARKFINIDIKNYI